jgi:hypothetical protein
LSRSKRETSNHLPDEVGAHSKRVDAALPGKLYDDFYSKLKARYGISDYRILAGAREIALAYETSFHKPEKVNAVYSFVQKRTAIHWGKWHDKTITAALGLVRVARNKLRKRRLADIQLQKIWDGIVNTSNSSLAKRSPSQVGQDTSMRSSSKFFVDKDGGDPTLEPLGATGKSCPAYSPVQHNGLATLPQWLVSSRCYICPRKVTQSPGNT